MRRNALIRIVLWSITLVVLVSILSGVLLLRVYRRESSTEAPLIIERTEEFTAKAHTTEAVNVRTSPSPDSSAVTMLEAGTSVSYQGTEQISGTEWAYLVAPCAGWVQTQYLEMETSVQETMVSRDPEDKVILPAEDVKHIDIDWVSGNILILPGNLDDIIIYEDNVSEEEHAMVWDLEENELEISFSKNKTIGGIGIGNKQEPEKELTIQVPKDWACESLDIDCASACVQIQDLTIGEVDFDGASGTCDLENCTVREMDMDTASGDIRFIGSLDMLDCDAASASVYAVLRNIPSRLDLDSMSGNLEICLPPDAGFTLAMDTMHKDFSTDFKTTLSNGNHVCGDGRCYIQVDALSGDVTIRKGA